MSKACKVFVCSCLSIVLIAMIGYLSLSVYYRNGFSLNTWINGVYCTGKSVQEVNSELLQAVKAPIVVLTDRYGKNYELNLADMDYQEDYSSELNQFMKEQNPYLWLDGIIGGNKYELAPSVKYNKDKLYESFCNLLPIKEEAEKNTDYHVEWDAAKEEYVLIDNLKNRFDVEKVWQAVLESIDNRNYNVDFSSLDCHYDIPLTEEQKEIAALWEKIEKFQNCMLVYDMGAEKIEFTAQVVSKFLMTEAGVPILDEKGELVLDRNSIEAFVKNLAKEYDTYGLEREFQATNGETIIISEGNYGTTLDQKAEVAFLTENLLLSIMHGSVKQEHIPVYEREGFARGKDDIGGTYIEIDMTAQKMYYYVDFALVIETDIVSGDMKRKWDTPEGVYYVYAKQRYRTLRGPGYESFVKYWMPVYKGIGIHDANWRKEFGGDVYLKDGSHGCINTPRDIMADLYEMVEIGTPVVMFY